MAGTLPSVTSASQLDLSKKRFTIVVADWNEEITHALFEGAYKALLTLGAKKKNIEFLHVPGSFELPLGAQWAADKKSTDAVICLGCVIQGGTPHFDYICQAVAQGIMDVNLRTRKPVAFGVLTVLNKKQAIDRAGGSLGNKGEEAAQTVVRMLEIKGR